MREMPVFSPQHFQPILDCMGAAVFILDEQYRFVYVNNTICERSGIPQERWLGKTGHDLFPKEQAETYQRHTYHVFETGEEDTNEEQTTDVQGNLLTITTTKTLYTDSTGARYVIGIIRDITERKQMEETLRSSEEKYRSIVEQTTEWIWEMDLNGVHTFSNGRITDILGYLPGEAIGLPVEALLHEEDLAEVNARLPGLVAEKRGWQGWVLRWRHKDGGYRYLESNAYPVLDADGNLRGYRGADRDITERKHAEQERERLILELKEALSHVKILKGLLPICASCKKVRDDKGYWNQIESYIREHSEAEFSHGLCPECAERLYPQIYRKQS